MKHSKQKVPARWPSASKRLIEAASDQPKPWPEEAEPYLAKSGVPEEMWPDVWSKVECLVRMRNNPPQGNSFLALPVIVPAKDRTASKQARYFRRLARRYRKARDTWRAANCEQYADHLEKLASGKKHGTHDCTRFLLALSEDVRAMSGRPHDQEVEGLLRCAGWHQLCSGTIRAIRAQNCTYQTKPSSSGPDF